MPKETLTRGKTVWCWANATQGRYSRSNSISDDLLCENSSWQMEMFHQSSKLALDRFVPGRRSG
jgi:hypothetical protein